jgi:hypothetical protein
VSIKTTICVDELSAQLTPKSEKTKGSRRTVSVLTEEEAKPCKGTGPSPDGKSLDAAGLGTARCCLRLVLAREISHLFLLADAST